MARPAMLAVALAGAGASCGHTLPAPTTAARRTAFSDDAALALDGVRAYMFAAMATPDPFTVEATLAASVYLDELPSQAGHIFHVCGKSGFGRDLDLQIETDNRFHFYVARGAPSVVISQTEVEPRRWYRVAVTYRSNDAILLYLDGVPQARRGIIGVARLPNVGPLSVGENFAFPGRMFHGLVDEVSFWNRALRPEEIAMLRRVPAGPAPGLVAAYSFDGNARDCSGNRFDGQVVGNAHLKSPGAPSWSTPPRLPPPIIVPLPSPAEPEQPGPASRASPPADG